MTKSKNIESLNMKSEIDLVKKELNICQSMKIATFQARYKPDGTLIDLRFTLVTFIGGKYSQIDANYKVDTGKYINTVLEFDDYFAYNSLYNENSLAEFFTLFDRKTFMPKDKSVDYESLNLQYVSGPNIFSADSRHEIYLVKSDGCEMFTDETARVKGFAMWLFGEKYIEGVKKNLSSNLYLFEPVVLPNN